MHHPRTAFTILEMSIVVAIVALIAGGIFMGQNLVRQAELRSVALDAQRYVSAIQNFRNQYRYMPGDMPNATRYWGALGSCPTGAATVGSTATCDGNGDGRAVVGWENWRAWQHLANAGLISGFYTGIYGAAGTSDALLGTNVPSSRITSVGFYFQYLADGTQTLFNMNYGNTFIIGKKNGTNTTPTYVYMNGTEAYNIDLKMDDGMPAKGKWVARQNGAASTNCTNASSTSNSSEFASIYSLNKVISCGFLIPTGY